MHMRILAVVLLAALVAAGLGYGLMRGKKISEPSLVPPEMAGPIPAPSPMPCQQVGPSVYPGPVPAPTAAIYPPIPGPGMDGGIPPQQVQPPPAAELPMVPAVNFAMMSPETKKAFLETRIKFSAEQAGVLQTYSTEAGLLRDQYVQIFRYASGMPVMPVPGMMPETQMAQTFRTLEQQQEAAEMLKAQIAKVIEARKVFIDGLDKDQAETLKEYLGTGAL